jgi:tRNA 2-thiocytidine biosynthesis protein TtcA
MFNALQNVVPSHLLDANLYDFQSTVATGVSDENGDKVFDAEEFPPPPALPGMQVLRLG